MTRYQYKPGWFIEVGHKNEYLAVTIFFDSHDADTNEPLNAKHTFQYSPTPSGLWQYMAGKPTDCWVDDAHPVTALADMDACVYDACVRFEIHEVKEFLKDADGNFLIHPHPEIADGGTDPKDLQPNEPRL